MSEKRYFQYLAGEHKDEICIFDSIEEEDDLVFVKFTDGRRCNEELILPLNNRNYSNQLMAEIDSPNNRWKFKEEWVGRQEERWETNADGEKVCVQPFIPGKKKVIPIPPRPTTSRFGQVKPQPKPQKTPEQKVEELSPEILKDKIEEMKREELQKKMSDPVYLMLEKAKKYSTEVPMVLTVYLPTVSLYDVVKESFDEGNKKFIDYIIDNLDEKLLKDSLRDALYSAYEGRNVSSDGDEKGDVSIQTGQQQRIIDSIKGEEKSNEGYFEPETIEEPKVGPPVIKDK
jgi:hypothetical protein